MSSSPSLNAPGPERSFQGLSPAHFRQVSPSSTSIELSSSPLVTEDTSLGDAFERVHEFLSTGVADSRATWLQAAATLVTDLCNGIRTSMATKPFSSFLTLSTAEQSHLDNLVISIASLSKFFTERRDNPDDWINCSRRMEISRLPVSEKNWKEILMTCGQDLHVAQNTVLNRGMRELHNQVDTWVGDQWALAQDAVINRLVSDNAPNFADILDPHLIEWSTRVLADLRTDMQARLLEDLDHEILQPRAADKVAAAIIVHWRTGNGTSIRQQQIQVQCQVRPQWTQWQRVNNRAPARRRCRLMWQRRSSSPRPALRSSRPYMPIRTATTTDRNEFVREVLNLIHVRPFSFSPLWCFIHSFGSNR